MRERKPPKGGFFVSESQQIILGHGFRLKTRVYVDGYNLYYGVLKKSPFKWLDPIKLAKLCCQISAPKHILRQLNGDVETKYFTAKVLNTSAFEKTAARDQDAYHEALQALYHRPELDIIFGYHTVTPVIRREFDYWAPNAPHAGCEKTVVWHIEEKQTDVNIAINSLKDAYTDPTEQLHIFVSNDSDLAPLINMLAQLPHIKTGIISPIRDPATRPSGQLIKNADWSTGALSSQILSQAQLPRVIQAGNKSIRKPIEWFGESKLASEVFEILLEGLVKRNSVYKWLEQDPVAANLQGLPNLHKPAIEMLDTKDEAKLVLEHAKAYISYVKAR